MVNKMNELGARQRQISPLQTHPSKKQIMSTLLQQLINGTTLADIQSDISAAANFNILPSSQLQLSATERVRVI